MAINFGNNLGNKPVATFEAGVDRRFPHFSVHEIGPYDSPRRFNTTTVARQKNFVIALEKPLKGRQIVSHVAFRRGHDGRIPAHDVVA